MTAPSTACPECGEDVPFGRRTCEACGANLTTAAALSESPTDDLAAEAEAGAEATSDEIGWDVPAGTPSEPGAADEPMVAMPAEPAAEPAPVEWPSPEPAREPAPEQAAATPFIPPVLREWNAGSPLPETGFAAELAAAEAAPTGLAGSWLPPAATPPGPLPDAPAMQYRAAESQPAADTAPVDAGPDAAAATPPPSAMPATLAAMLNRTSTGTPRWPEADAGTSESPSHARPAATMPPVRMPDIGPGGSAYPMVPPTAPTAARRPLEPGRAPLFADLPFDAPNTLPGWLVAGGGAIATVSFLLPWVAVIDSYFTAWGLGSISNLPVFLVVFGTTALAILPSRLADWLRHGILGLAVGSFILGVTWNRLVGATGGQLGVILEGTGALLLLIGGILAIVRDRGAADGPDERR